MFDFGGVIAEEGFIQGLGAIARQNHLAEEAFIETAHEVIYSCGYLLGKASETDFWAALKDRTGIRGDDTDLRTEILSRFLIRPWMLQTVKRLRRRGIRTGILSDQTDWLDLLNDRHGFFKYFDTIFNSYHLGDGKRNPGLFDEIVRRLDVPAAAILFIDDNAGHCARARERGWRAIHYAGRESFFREMADYFSFLDNDSGKLPEGM